jgi:hypothetical protein
MRDDQSVVEHANSQARPRAAGKPDDRGRDQPGLVKTDMGGPDALLTARESVQAMVPLAGRLTLTDTGAVLDHGDVLAAGGERW